MPLNCRPTQTSLALFRKFSGVNGDSLSNYIISENPMYIELQQSMKVFHMSIVYLRLWHSAFENSWLCRPRLVRVYY